jgi:[ribosomal protein S5]-alanine N-acetyltransferase
VGFAGLLHSPDTPPSLVVGISPQRWRQGLAMEATSRILDHVFGTLELPEVRADVDEPNTASVRLLERLGFSLDRRGVVDGRPLLYYRIARETWSRRLRS